MGFSPIGESREIRGFNRMKCRGRGEEGQRWDDDRRLVGVREGGAG